MNFKPVFAATAFALTVAGCTNMAVEETAPAPAAEPAPVQEPMPEPPVMTESGFPSRAPSALPGTSATPVGSFDTASNEERAAATSEPTGNAALGTTLATLGSPTETGYWVKTDLVGATQSGSVAYNGKTVNVELRPLTGSGGSQISLSAMRELGAPLTDIVEVQVYAG
ncbi:D-galactarate dehydratase [Marivivens aquimaris]|uniref:D-galactarate dehydratase n=1 Tax=Marivivens aquimaris TaxID=2774876 RepID=UPI001880B002|nr:D-galactarate dehydratase [Marivivens aquimaris]